MVQGRHYILVARKSVSRFIGNRTKTYNIELQPFQHDSLRQRPLNSCSSDKAIKCQNAYSQCATAPDKWLLLLCSAAPLRPSIVPTNTPLISRYIIDESQFLWVILRHPPDKINPLSFISLPRYALQLLVAHPGSLEFTTDSGEVKRDKPVGLEQVEKLVEKVVGIFFDEML